MPRQGSVILAFLLLGQVEAQTCVRLVSGVDDSPVQQAEARCLDGARAGVSGEDGLLCIGPACDTLRIMAPGHEDLILVQGRLASGEVVHLAPLVLDPVVVDPWPRRRDRQGLAAVSTLDSALLAGFDRSSLRSAAQWTPGVQWDQRGAGGSQRLSMRGSLLRSAFGVRGVKVYWGPFPLTLADGSTPLELLDPMMAATVDVIRSIGSPIYGSAPSGMILTQAPFRNTPGMDAAAEVLGGSYGYARAEALVRVRKGDSYLSAGAVRQRSDGYRVQEWSARDQVFLAYRHARARNSFTSYFTWQRASWALPGSLDSLTAMNAPHSARPYSQAINAHIEKYQLMVGAAYDRRLGEHLYMRTALHTQLIDKRNPYGTSVANCGYKDEAIRAVGARSVLSGDRSLGRLPVAWELGVEALAERDLWRENTYVNGQIGALKVDADTRVINVNAFAMSTTRLSSRTLLQLGMGFERTAYDHRDALSGTRPAHGPRPSVHPTIGFEYSTPRGLELHVRYAGAESRATVWEYLGTTGVFNDDLRGEQVKEMQVGAVMERDSSGTRLEATAFWREVQRVILASTAPNGSDQVYINAGRATIAGLELRTNTTLRTRDGGRMHLLFFAGAYPATLRLKEGPSIADIPGSPALSSGLLVRATLPWLRQLTWELGGRLTSDVRASTENDRRVAGVATAHGRITFAFRAGGARWTCFGHVENLLDRSYTGWVQVNDPGGRYFNPAAGRSFLAGVSVRLGNDPHHRQAAAGR